MITAGIHGWSLLMAEAIETAGGIYWPLSHLALGFCF